MTNEEIKRNFTYYPPTRVQALRYELLRKAGRLLAMDLEHFCPDSREKALAMTYLEQAIMWATPAVARNDGPPVSAIQPDEHGRPMVTRSAEDAAADFELEHPRPGSFVGQTWLTRAKKILRWDGARWIEQSEDGQHAPG